MKYKILLYGLLAVMVTGCSSAYKSTQTPDDVYYSPAAVQKQGSKEDKYEDYAQSSDDRYLRMKSRDRQRWSSLDDYDYWNDSRYVPCYSYDYYRNNWNNSYAWNNWNSPVYYPMYAGSYNYSGYYYPQYGYNPYSTTVYITKYPVSPVSGVNRPSLSGYTNRSYSNTNSMYNGNTSGRQSFGNTLKRVFSPSSNGTDYSNRNSTNSSNNTYTAPTRTYSPSSSSSSGSSSSGSSSGSVTRPPRH